MISNHFYLISSLGEESNDDRASVCVNDKLVNISGGNGSGSGSGLLVEPSNHAFSVARSSVVNSDTLKERKKREDEKFSFSPFHDPFTFLKNLTVGYPLTS